MGKKPHAVFPNNLRPMPLKRHREPFSPPDWLFELKHDGFRALAFVSDGACRLVSRNGNPFARFGAMCEEIAAELDCDAVLDADIVCLDYGDYGGNGKSRSCSVAAIERGW